MGKKLKPWHTVVTPREDLREGKPLDAAEFAVHLDKVRDGNAPKDYQDPRQFFEKTYLTRNLLDLSSQVVRRLAGVKTETSAVFNLATQFGGGKTHALTLLYHLCKNGAGSHSWAGVAKILDKSAQREVHKGEAAVFVGTEFDSIVGRGGEDGTPLRKTPWGEIAFQLGGEQAFSAVAQHDESGMAPGGDVIQKIIPKDKPCLILMDELMNYISRNRKSGLSDQFYNFVQNLTGTVCGLDRAVLAVSIPASEMEMNERDTEDYNRLTKLLDRLGKALVMSAESETSEIIRRRLFEWNLDAMTEDGRVMLDRDALNTCGEFSQWVVDHRHQVPSWFSPDDAKKFFESTYPFHPTVLSVFERKWRGIPKFQQTRGILRLLALWVSKAYKEGYEGAHRDMLISLGTAPLEDPTFRSACFEQLGERNLETAVTTDINGSKNAHAVRLDKEATEDIRKTRLHQKVATSIFFESNGGQVKGKEASVPEIRLSVGDPALDIGNVETALEALTDACYYLTIERNQYRFSLRENLNKRYADRRATIPKESALDRLKSEIQKVFTPKEKIERIWFPEKSIQIPDRPVLTMVIADVTQTMEKSQSMKQFVDRMLRESGASARTFKSAQIWCVVDSARAMREETIRLLAWEDIDDEASTLNLDESQQRQLKENIHRSKRDLKESIWRSYKHVLLLGQDNAVRVIDLGLVHSSAAHSPVDHILDRLMQEGDLEKGVSANFVMRNWPPAFKEWSIKGVRDAFFASPQFPKLLYPDAVKDTVARGVTNGLLAYVGKKGDGSYEPFNFQAPLNALDVEISEEMFIIPRETAEEYLAKIKESETSKDLDPQASEEPKKPEETQFPPQSTESTGATINDHQGTGNAKPVQLNSFKKLNWSGNVPSQKWMHFYTKVLSKFAADKNLEIKVEFTATPESGLSKQKVEETKSALKELGLDSHVEPK